MKSVRIAELKAHLSAYLRSVQRGVALRVLDRDTPIAEIVPLANAPKPKLSSRPGKGRPGDYVFLLPPVDPPIDVLAELLDERKDHS